MAQWRIVSGKIPTSSQIAPRVIRAARSLVRPGRGRSRLRPGTLWCALMRTSYGCAISPVGGLPDLLAPERGP
jgi:hypothetical protein